MLLNYVSCQPGVLYRAGGFHDAPEVLAALVAEAAPVGVSFVQELFPPCCYTRPAPALALTADPAFATHLDGLHGLLNRDQNKGAASALIRLDRGRIHGNVLYPASAAGTRILYETHRPNDRPYVPQVNPADPPYPIAPVSGPDALHLFIGSAGTSNYGHWLVDDLPRAAAAFALQPWAAGRTLHIWITDAGEPMNHVRAESLLAFCAGLPIEVRVMPLDRVFEYEQLYYATPCSYHPSVKSPDAMARLARPFTPGARRGTRLFVTRRGARGRGLSNAAAVERRFVAAGFTVVDPDGMPFLDQVDLFAHAAAIAGVMGAAMTNTVFAAPGTALLYLAPDGWAEPFYWDLAATRRHRYGVCYGPPTQAGQPAHLSRFRMDLGLLDRAIADLIGA